VKKLIRVFIELREVIQEARLSQRPRCRVC